LPHACLTAQLIVPDSLLGVETALHFVMNTNIYREILFFLGMIKQYKAKLVT